MGLCCSCLEDNTGPRQQHSTPPPFVHVQQPRPQQRRQLQWQQGPSANHFLAPATTTASTSTRTTAQVVRQQPADYSRVPPPASYTPRQNRLLIQPGVTVTQQVTIVASVQNCDACGKSDHTKEVCRYRERLCFYCREEGHIISVCPAKKRQQQRKRQQHQHAQRKRQRH